MEIQEAIRMHEDDGMPDAIHRVLCYMLENFAEEMSLDELADVANVTKFNLCRNFRRRYGVSPMRWLWIFRTLLAGEFIKLTPDWSLTDIAFTCGFSSSAHFSRSFSSIMKKSPSSFRRSIIKKNSSQKKQTSARSSYRMMFQDNSKMVLSAFSSMLSYQCMN